MGIEYHDMRAILRVLKRENPPSFERLLILGDAIIHFPLRELKALAAEAGIVLASEPETLTPQTLGAALGFRWVDTLDINGRTTLNHDLTQALPDALLGRYDMIIDAGVLFWCFEPGVALKNIFRLSTVDGLIFHITALSGYYGRGYYNIHPRLFEDFYLSNQCVFLQSSFRTKARLSRRERTLKWLARMLGTDNHLTSSVSYRDAPGAIFLGKVRHDRIEFEKTSPAPEADMIPNNMVSTFACRKMANMEPSVPLQAC